MGLFDLSSVVMALSPQTVTVTRYNATSYDSHGKASESIASTFSAFCSVQPITGEKQQAPSEGERNSEVVSIWSNTTLVIGDRVTLPGRGTYEVYAAEAWEDFGNYSKTMAQRMNESEL